MSRSFAWDITPWHVLHIVRRGSPVDSARAKFRAFRVSPSLRFFSWSTPDPVHEAPFIASYSSSTPSLAHTSTVAANNSGQAPRETHPG